MAYSAHGSVIGPITSTAQNTTFLPPLREVSGLPSGFPTSLDSVLAWSGPQLAVESDYVLELGEPDIAELELALQHFKGASRQSRRLLQTAELTVSSELGLDGDLVTRDNFPLPSLAIKLAAVRQDVHEGRGFKVIRGLNPKKYSVEDLTVLYLGIQVYVANRHGRQDKKGNMMGMKVVVIPQGFFFTRH